VRDTIKRVDEEGLITETLDRTVLRACQTPQVFRGDALRRAHRSAVAAGRTATDDAALLESTGARVGTFAGRWVKYKITMPLDLELARLLIERGEVSGQ
jgi:2-C-methyl-D-erythritol 4-phosphate cytidylyltransferase